MYCQSDWILGQIQMMTRFIIMAIFGIDIPIQDLTNEEIYFAQGDPALMPFSGPYLPIELTFYT